MYFRFARVGTINERKSGRAMEENEARRENQITVDLSLMSVIHDERRKDNASLHAPWQYPANLWR